MDVGGERIGELGVDAVGHMRVVVAGQDHDRSLDGLQQLTGGLDVGLLDADVVEEIAGDDDDGDILLNGEVEDVLEGAEGGFERAILASRLGGVGAEMDIGGVKDAQGVSRRT